MYSKLEKVYMVQ